MHNFFGAEMKQVVLRVMCSEHLSTVCTVCPSFLSIPTFSNGAECTFGKCKKGYFVSKYDWNRLYRETDPSGTRERLHKQKAFLRKHGKKT